MGLPSNTVGQGIGRRFGNWVGGFVSRSYRALLLCCVAALLILAEVSTPALAQCGTRRVTVTGDTNPANNCLSASTPCRSINHAIAVACVNDTISVGEGSYFEDVIADKRVFIDSSGSNPLTLLRGTGASDIVSLLATGAQLNGFTVDGPASGACVRIGDSAHPGVRSAQITNSTMRNCRYGVLIDAIGTVGDWNRISGNVIELNDADSIPDSGSGVLLRGGSGRVQLRQNTMRNNDGPALKQLAGSNNTLEIAGNTISGNGGGSLATSRAGLDIRQGRDIFVEGNYFTANNGTAAANDGVSVLIDGVTTGSFVCNQMTSNENGLEIKGTVSGLDVLQNRFAQQSNTALMIRTGSATGATINENLFLGNAQGTVNQDVVSANLKHNWWGAASGPPSVGGTGNTATGPSDVSNFIARTAEPVLARAPKVTGWSRSATGAACYDTLQPAINAAPTGGLVLIGKGEIPGRVVLNRAVDLEGVPGRILYAWCDHCNQSVIDATQYNEPRKPGLQIIGVSGIYVKYITIHGAGMGTPACLGGHQDTEIGLDLQNVKNSVFDTIDLRENGTTDIRLLGDCDDNTIRNVYLDGMIRDGDNEDRCGHRSREGILIDGGPRSCESGAGAYAERNKIFDSFTYHITRSIKLKYAKNTEIANNAIHGVPSDEWPETNAVNLWVEASDDTWIHDNPEIGNRGVHEAIRITGSHSCEAANSARTKIERSTISMVENSGVGVRLQHLPSYNGTPVDTTVTCSTIEGARTAIQADYVSGATVTLTDITSDTYGVQNDTTNSIDATRSWWGSASGPSGAGPGTGTSISTNVAYAPQLTSSSRNDADGDGFTECTGDADDTNPLLKPFDSCDGFDNDQDGTIDENFVAQATQCGAGPCAASGSTTCISGVPGNSCVPLPPLASNDVTCDAVDDDCDGSVDEEYNAGNTSCGVGGCARTGFLGCVNGVEQNTCNPGNPAPNDGVCNAIDDDCDGPVDEEFAVSTTNCGTGVCASTGQTSCTSGVAGNSCVPGTPTASTDVLCNGLDEDCDGATDEEYAPHPESCGLGVCARTITTSCSGGVENATCVPGPQNEPTDAHCDGLDDDCDGPVDEDFVPFTTACGVGQCGRLGLVVCSNGALADQCTPGLPITETCNGIDDDCNGVVDNVAVPAQLSQLQARRSGDAVVLQWEDRGVTSFFDIVRGDTETLVSSGGNYSAAISDCLYNDLGTNAYNDADAGPLPGAARWYLVRPANCGGRGTYDDGSPGLFAPRDASIAAAPGACP